MKLRLSILLCLCTLWGNLAPIHAADSYRSVVVTTASGSTMRFDLSEGVDVQFSESEFTITAGSSEVSLPVTEVARFDFSTDPAAVESQTKTTASLRIAGQDISVTGLKPDSPVILCAANGLLIASSHADSEGSFSASNLEAGTYILKTNLSTLKFLIRK